MKLKATHSGLSLTSPATVRESWRRGWKANNFTVDRITGHFVDRYIAVSYANARYLIEEKGLPKDYGPVLLRRPFRFHLTVDTRGCPIVRRK